MEEDEKESNFTHIGGVTICRQHILGGSEFWLSTVCLWRTGELEKGRDEMDRGSDESLIIA